MNPFRWWGDLWARYPWAVIWAALATIVLLDVLRYDISIEAVAIFCADHAIFVAALLARVLTTYLTAKLLEMKFTASLYTGTVAILAGVEVASIIAPDINGGMLRLLN